MDENENNFQDDGQIKRTGIIPMRQPAPLGSSGGPSDAELLQSKKAKEDYIRGRDNLLVTSTRAASFTTSIGAALARNVIRKGPDGWEPLPLMGKTRLGFYEKEKLIDSHIFGDGTKVIDEASREFLMDAHDIDDYYVRVGELEMRRQDAERNAVDPGLSLVYGLAGGAVADLGLSAGAGAAFGSALKAAGVVGGLSRTASAGVGAVANVGVGIADARLRGEDYESFGLDLLLGLAGGFTGGKPKSVQAAKVQTNVVNNAVEPLLIGRSTYGVGPSAHPTVFDVEQQDAIGYSGQRQPGQLEGPPDYIDVEARIVPEPGQYTALGYSPRQGRPLASDATPDMFGAEPKVPSIRDIDDSLARARGESLVATTVESNGTIKSPGKSTVTIANGLDYAAYQFALIADKSIKAAGKAGGFLAYGDMPANAKFNQTLPADALALVSTIRESLPGLTDAQLYAYAKRVFTKVNELQKPKADPDAPKVYTEAELAQFPKETRQKILKAQKDAKKAKKEPVVVDEVWREFTQQTGVESNPLITPLQSLVAKKIETPEKVAETIAEDVAKVEQQGDLLTATEEVVEAIVEETPVESPVLDKRLDAVVAAVDKAVESGKTTELEATVAKELVAEAKREAAEVREILQQVGKEAVDSPDVPVPESIKTAQLVIGGKKVPAAFSNYIDKALALAYKPKKGAKSKAYGDAVAYIKALRPELTEADINEAAEFVREFIIKPELVNKPVVKAPENLASEILGPSKEEVAETQVTADPSFKAEHFNTGVFQKPANTSKTAVNYSALADYTYQVNLIDALLSGKIDEVISNVRAEVTHWESVKTGGGKLTNTQSKRLAELKKRLAKDEEFPYDGFVPESESHLTVLSPKALAAKKASLEKLIEAENQRIEAKKKAKETTVAGAKVDPTAPGAVTVITDPEAIAKLGIVPGKPKEVLETLPEAKQNVKPEEELEAELEGKPLGQYFEEVEDLAYKPEADTLDDGTDGDLDGPVKPPSMAQFYGSEPADSLDELGIDFDELAPSSKPAATPDEIAVEEAKELYAERLTAYRELKKLQTSEFVPDGKGNLVYKALPDEVVAKIKELNEKVRNINSKLVFIKFTTKGLFPPSATIANIEKQTKSKPFKKWFGKSKVVNPDGSPMVMYHGSYAAGFNVFDSQVREIGFLTFFSPDKFFAKKFDSQIYQVFIKAENPFDYTNVKQDTFTKFYKWLETNSSLTKDAALKSFSEEWQAAVRKGGWEEIESPLFVRFLKDSGYDSLYVQEKGIKNIAVFDPRQIKSATANEGTFDPTNPDIRYSQVQQAVQAFSQATGNLFGKLGEKLVASGKLRIVQSVNDLPGKHPADVKGMYDPKTGTAYVVMDNMSSKRDLYSTVLHEIGVHMGMPKIFGNLWPKLLAQVESDPKLKALREELKGKVNEKHLNEETIAYYVQANPEASFTRRIIAGIKLWAYKLTGGRFVKLGSDDMVAIAVQALRKEARSYDQPFGGAYVNGFTGWDGARDSLPNGHPDEPMYSLMQGLEAAQAKAKPSPAKFKDRVLGNLSKSPEFVKTMGYRISESVNPYVRFAEGFLTSFDINGNSASNGSLIFQEQHARTKVAPFMEQTAVILREYRKELGAKVTMGNARVFQKFERDVKMAVEGVIPEADWTPAVRKQVELTRKYFKDSLADVREIYDQMAARGFKMENSLLTAWNNLKENPNYLPRLLNFRNFRMLVDTVERKGVVDLIEKSMSSANPGLKPEKSRLMAEAYVRWIEFSETHNGSQILTLGLSKDELSRTILEADTSGYFKGLTKKDFEEIVDTILDTQQVIEASDTRTRARISLDMGAYVDVNGERVYLAEMFETSVTNLVNRYQQQLSGIIGRAKGSMLKPLPIDPESIDLAKLPEFVIERNGKLYADQTHERFYGWLRSMIESSGTKDESTTHVQLMEDLDALWRQLNGQPMDLSNDKAAAQAFRALRNFATFQRAWFFAFSVTAEVGKQFNSRTFKAAVKHFPGLMRDIFALRSQAGRYEAAKRMAEFASVGLDSAVLPAYKRFDGATGTLDALAENASTFTLRRSGFLAVNNAVRLFIARLEMDHLMRVGHGDIEASPADIKRYQAYGIPEAKLKEVSEQMVRHFKDGELDYKSFQAENWENAELAKAYIYRMVKKGSSEAAPDQKQSWRESVIGKTATQFQSSAIDGFHLSGLQEAQFRDAEMFTGFLSGWVGGAVGYAGVTAMRNYQNEEELRKKFTAAEIAKNAFARAAFAGIVTKVMDLVSVGMGFQPIFSGRTTADQQQFSIPALSGVSNLPTAIGSVTGAPFGATTQSEAKRAMSMVGGAPLLLIPGIEGFIQSSLPKRVPKDKDDLLSR